MGSIEELNGTAPEVFDETLTPRELADYFRQYADEMVQEGLAKRVEQGIVSPEGKGLDITFDEEEKTADDVLLEVDAGSEHVMYRISFYLYKGSGPQSGYSDSVHFSTSRYERYGDNLLDRNEFVRTVLESGDTEVNEFFSGLAAAIAPPQAAPEKTNGHKINWSGYVTDYSRLLQQYRSSEDQGRLTEADDFIFRRVFKQTPEEAPALYLTMAASTDPYVRAKVADGLESLAHLDPILAGDIHKKLLQDEDEGVRRAAWHFTPQ